MSLPKRVASTAAIALLIALPALTAAQTTGSQYNVAGLLAQIQKLQALMAQLQAANPSLSSTTPPPPPQAGSCVNLTQNMHYRSTDATTGGQVTTLQNYLIANGYLSGTATGFYGLATTQAVGKLQVSLGITSSGSPNFGFMGPKTRAAIYCSGAGSLSVIPSSGNSPLTVTFTAQSDPANSSIDFGDGATATTCVSDCPGNPWSVIHVYAAPGTYTATLRDSSGASLGTATIVAYTPASGGLPTAIIAPSALFATTTPNPTIYGSAANIINSYGNALTVNYSGAGVSGGGYAPVVNGNGRWQFPAIGGTQLSLASGTYTIQVADPTSGNVLTTGTLVVNSDSPGAPTASLVASSDSITAGDSATLSWTSTNAATCTGDGFPAFATASSVTVTPSVTTTYSITCTGAGGTSDPSTATVTVDASAPLPTASLTVDTPSIAAGQSVTLTWSSTDATSCTGDGFTPTDVAGSMTVTPFVTTTYAISCSGDGGTSNPSSVTVTVSFPVPTATITASVNGTAPGTNVSAKIGDSIAYAWSSTNGATATATYSTEAAQCSATGTGPFTWVNGQTLSGSATATVLPCQAGHTYTVTYTVTDSNGHTAVATMTIQVAASSVTPSAAFMVSVGGGAPSTEITAHPGQSLTYSWTATNMVSSATSYTANTPDRCPNTGTGGGTFNVPAFNRTGTQTTLPIASCRAGHTYTVVYTVTGIGGAKASASVIIHVVTATSATSDSLSQLASAVAALQSLLQALSGLMGQSH